LAAVRPLGPVRSWVGLGVVRGGQLGPWAAEVRYIVIPNNSSTTEAYGVRELSLAPHRATMLTTKHSPAEIARKKSGVGVECSPVSCSTAACSR
jgi:hypothetical protein